VVLAGSEGRVQEKAWDAFVEILVRSADARQLEKWGKTLADAKQLSRRVQLLARVYARWDQRADLKPLATRALEALVQAQLDQRKWAAAAPLVQNLLSRSDGEAARTRCLDWLQEIAALALKDGNRAETLRIIHDARVYLPRGDKRTLAFDKLEQQAARKE
jgi:hypothetical protein